MVEIPDISDVFSSLSVEQKDAILNQAGYTQYIDKIYYDSDNANPYEKLRTSFELGSDYANKDIDFGSDALQQNRWLIDDVENSKKYIIYAQDVNNDGKFESIKLQEAAKLTGQRGFGILMNGTLTSLKDGADLVFASKEDTIFRGNVNIMGDNSNITLQSDKWVYAEGQFDVTGDITMLGGIALDGTDLDGSNEHGDSVYVGKTTTLNTKEAGTTITIKGSKDVDILGAVVAGGTIGSNGVEFAGVDSSVVVEAGEQVFVDTVLTASSNVSITTTKELSQDDKAKSVVLTTGAGLSTAGLSSHESDGGGISIDAKSDVSVMSMILAGGNKTLSEDGISYDVTYSDKASSLSIISEGQAYIGGLTEAKSGNIVEIGSTLTATGSIYVEGGDSLDGNSVILPGSAKLVTNFVDSSITLKGSQNVLVSGVIAAGGEATDVYDEDGELLGTKMEYFTADKEKYERGSSIVIEAGYQAKIARSLYAGMLIDVRGGAGDVFAKENAQEGEELSIFVDDGVVIGSTVSLKTGEENSKINLSSSGNLIVTSPIWSEEITSQGFSKHSSGVLDDDVTLHLEFKAGDNIVNGEVKLFTEDTQSFENLLDLKNYIENQIHEFKYSVVSSTDESVEVGTLVDLDEQNPELNLNLDDGIFEFVSNGEIKILTTSINAELIGLDTTNELTSIKAYAIDASTKGSSINIGKEGELSGDVSVGGKLIAYDGVNFASGDALDGFTQEVEITSTALIESLNGSMVLNPGENAQIFGTFIARGEGATIEVSTTGRLDLHGSLIAEEGISIYAGSEIIEGEVSVQTYGTGLIKTLSDDSSISIIGVNDVNIDTIVGQDGADLKLIEIGSTDGTLTVDKKSGQIITTGQVVLSGNNLVLAGVIRSDYYTDKTYDYELEIKTKGDIDLSGVIDTKGSMLISGGGDVDIYSTSLIANEAGDKIEIYAGGNLNLGTSAVTQGIDQAKAVVIQADKSLEIGAGGVMNLGYDFQGYVGGDDSELIVNAGTLNNTSTLKAGFSVDFDTLEVTQTGSNSSMEVYVDEALIMGGQALDENLDIVTRGANLIATGTMDIATGSNEDGVGLVLSSQSAIKSNDSMDILSDGSVQLDGVLKADGTGADLSIKSDGLMYVDTLVYATNELSVIGGTSEDGTGLFLEEFTFDEDGNRLTGGTLDTATGGTITVGASENVFLNGVVGQLDVNDESKTDTINLVSDSGVINVLQSIDAINSVNITTKDLNLVQSTSIATSSDTGSVTIDASGEVYIQKAQDGDNFDAQLTSGKLDLNAGSIVMDGLITLKDATQSSTMVSSGDTDITGLVSSAGALTMGADNFSLTSQAKIDVEKDLGITTTGEFNLDADVSIGATKTILIPKFVTVEKTIKVPGGTTQVENGTYTVKVSAGLNKTLKPEIIDNEDIDVGDKYFTFDIQLDQEGYRNSSGTLKETFIEGVDYSNSLLSLTTDYKASDYKTWQDLNDDQRDIILNNKGYKKSYTINVTNIYEHVTKNGVLEPKTLKSYSDLPWASESKRWVKIDVDGFRDKYINIEAGLQDHILSTVYNGYSQITSAGYEDGVPRGENVGYYWDEADVDYTQDKSIFTGDLIPSTVSDKTGYIGDKVGSTKDSDGSDGRWVATYESSSGKRYYDIKNINVDNVNRDPNWFWESSSNVEFNEDDVYSGTDTRYTDLVWASANFKEALVEDTVSLTQTTKLSVGTQNVGTYEYHHLVSEAKKGRVTLYTDSGQEGDSQKYYSNEDGTRNSTYVSGDIQNDASSKSTNDYVTKIEYKHSDGIHDGEWTTSWHDDSIKEIRVYGVEAVYKDGTGIIEEKYYDYESDWKSKNHTIYDSRGRYNYSVTTQNEDIYEKRAIWGEVESLKETFKDETRTLWKTVQAPDVEQSVLFTELREVEGEGRSVAQFGSKSISAANITINSKENVNIKGAIEASENFVLDTEGAFTLDGMTTTDGIELLSTIDAKSQMSISSDEAFKLTDKSELALSDENGVVTIDSESSLLLDGEIIAGATLDATAGGDVELKSKILADTSVSIEVTKGEKNGSLTTNEEFVVDTINLTLGAGDEGGDLVVKNSILKASDTITLNAKSGKVTAPQEMQTVGESEVLVKAVIDADILNIDTKNGIELEVTTNKLNASATGTGDIDIVNLSGITLQDISANDGAIDIVSYGDIDAQKVSIASDNKRANLNLTSKKTTTEDGAINIGEVAVGANGTVTLNSPSGITKTDGGKLTANTLLLNVSGGIDLRTDVDTITFTNSDEAAVSINQVTAKTITFDGAKVANGTLDIVSQGGVALKDVEMLTDAKDVSVTAQGDISIDKLVALGANVSLNTQANIKELGNDADADITSKTLSLEAIGDISDIEISVDQLTKASGANVGLNSLDKDLNLVDISATDTIDLKAQKNILTTTASSLVADTIKLESLEKNIDIVAGSTFTQTKGVSLVANQGFFDIYEFMSGTELTQYETSKDFQFGDSFKLGNITSDNVILKTTGNIVIDGTITAKDSVELESGENVSLWGIKGISGNVSDVSIVALGTSDITKNSVKSKGGNISISQSGTAGTGFEVEDFELRANNNVVIDIDGDLALSGFIGGLEGFDSNENITLRAGSGDLSVAGSIVSANGLIDLQADNIISDSSSVFMATDLKAKANGDVSLNTAVDALEIDSLTNGDITINEADNVVLKRLDARDGFIKVSAGGDITAEIVRTHIDNVSNTITLKATGTIYDISNNALSDRTSQKSKVYESNGGIIKAGTFTENTTSASTTIDSNANISNAALYMDTTSITGSKTISSTTEYTVITLPTVAGDFTNEDILTISSGTGASDNLTIVAPINVGLGSVELSSGGAISLGDKVTADKVTTTSSGSINMISEIKTLDLTVSGTGDVNVSQSGDLVVDKLETHGGDVYFFVDGNVVMNNVTGNAKSFTVEVSDGHSITVNGQTYSSGVTSFKAQNGTVSANVNMTTLDLVSSGVIDLSDADGFSLDSYVTTDRTQNFSIESSSGETVIDADISREGAGELTLDTGALTLKKSLSSDTAITLDAQGTITLDSYVDITTSDDAITFNTTGAIDISNESLVNAGNADISLSATNDIKVGKLKTTSSGDLTITSTSGAIIDSGDGNIDIDALNANLVLSANSGIGASDALETNVASVEISNITSGDVNIEELDDLTITSYANGGGAGAITTVGGDMVVSAMSAGSSSTLKLDTNNITLGGAITTTGASVEVVANKGDITLAHSITAGGSGDISLESVEGKIDADGVLLNAQNGDVSLVAYGTIDAKIDSKGLFISSTSKADINIDALQDLSISGESLAVVNIDTPSGKQAIVSEFDTGDEDIDFSATDLDIQGNVKTTGDIEMKAKDADATLRFGSTADDKAGEYTLDLEESKLLGDTVKTVKVGSVETTGDIVFGDDEVSEDIEDTIEVKSNLEIVTSGKTYLNSNLEAESIKLYGPHYTLALNADMSSENEVEIHDSLKVGGDNSIVAGTYMVLTSDAVEFIQGDGDAVDDKLTLNANGGNIDISGNIGASEGTQFDGATVDNLEEFNIIDLTDNSAGAIDVNIAQDLYVDGDVTIHATGDVVFGGVVDIAGSFTVIGANSITFASTVSVANDMSLEANEIDFNDVANSVDVDGEITLKATDASRAVLVAQDDIKSNALNIDADDMASIADGFSAINFGKVGGGDVKLSTDRDFNSDLGLYGKNITIQDNDTNTEFNIGANLDVVASKNINLANNVEAIVNTSLVTTDGKIKLYSDKTLDTTSLTLEANSGIVLDKLILDDTLSAINNASGAISLNILDTSASSIDVANLKQTDATSSGNISLSHENGSVAVNGVTVAGSGDVEITAQQGSITLDGESVTGSGAITLDAKDNITIDANSNISSTGYGAITFITEIGSITQNSDVTSEGGLITYESAGDITMGGSAITSTFDDASNDAKVIFEALGDIALGSVGADGIIDINAGGAITDALVGDEAIKNLFGDTTVVKLEAKNGVGASADADLDTDIASLSVLNKTDNGIYIEDQDDLLLNSSNIISKGETGDIELTSTGGDITIANTIVNNAIAGGVKIQAQNIIDSSLDDETQEISATHLSLIATTGSVSSMNVDTDSLVYEAKSGDTTLVNPNTLEINSIYLGGGGTFDLTTKKIFANSLSSIEANVVNVTLDGDDLTFGSDANKISTTIGTLNLNFTAVDINIDESDDLTLNTKTADKITLKGDNITLNLSDADSSFGTTELAAKTEITSLDLTVGSGVINIDEKDDISLTFTQSQNDTQELTLKSQSGDITLNSNVITDASISYEADELIFTTNAQDMLGSSTVRANTDVTKITGTNLSDIYIDEVDSLVLNIQSANNVDIKTTASGISLDQITTLNSLKLDQQSIVNNAITNNLVVSDMNLIANDGIDIDFSNDMTLTLESNNGDIKVTNTNDTILGTSNDKDAVSVKNNHNIDISSKNITFNGNDGYKDIKSIGNGDVKLNATGGNLIISNDMELGSSEFILIASDDIKQNSSIISSTSTTQSTISAGRDYIMSDDSKTELLGKLDITARNIELGKVAAYDKLTINASDIQEAQEYRASVKLVSNELVIDADTLGKTDNILEIKTVNLDITNENSDWYYTIITNPTVDITTSLGEYTNEEFDVTFTFSDAVSGFEIGDMNIQNATVVSELTTDDNITYHIMLKPTDGFEGELKVSVAEDKAFDIDNYGNIESLQYTVNADTVLPTLKIQYQEKDRDAFREDPTIEYTFVFSEGVYNFTPDDITVVNGTADTSFSNGVDGDTVYQLKITPTEYFTGMMSVYVNGGLVDDVAGNKMLKSQISSQEISSSVYGIYGNLVLEENKTHSIEKFTNEFKRDKKQELNYALDENDLPKSIYIDIEDKFNIDNTMIPGFDLLSLKPVNLMDFNNEEFIFEYWVNSLVI